MGDDANLITEICNGTHSFSDKLKKAKNPVIIVGSDLLARPDGSGILANLQTFAKDFKCNVSISFLILWKSSFRFNWLFTDNNFE